MKKEIVILALIILAIPEVFALITPLGQIQPDNLENLSETYNLCWTCTDNTHLQIKFEESCAPGDSKIQFTDKTGRSIEELAQLIQQQEFISCYLHDFKLANAQITDINQNGKIDSEDTLMGSVRQNGVVFVEDKLLHLPAQWRIEYSNGEMKIIRTTADTTFTYDKKQYVINGVNNYKIFIDGELSSLRTNSFKEYLIGLFTPGVQVSWRWNPESQRQVKAGTNFDEIDQEAR